MSEPPITVSRETLRAELAALELRLATSLAALELRLLDRLADKATVDALAGRTTLLERTMLVRGGPMDELAHELDKRTTRLEEWRNRIAGGLAVVTIVGAANAARLWLGV